MKFILLMLIALVVVVVGIFFWIMIAGNEFDHCEYLVTQKYSAQGNELLAKLAKKQISMAEFTLQNEPYQNELVACKDDTSKKYFVPSAILDMIQNEKLKSLGIQ